MMLYSFNGFFPQSYQNIKFYQTTFILIILTHFYKVNSLECYHCLDCGDDPPPTKEKCCDSIGVDPVCLVSID